MREARLVALPAVAILATLSLPGCNPLAAPPRPKTDGYLATAALRDGAKEQRWEIAVRGQNRRREPADGQPGKVLVIRGEEKKAFELDPAARTWAEVPFTGVDVILPGHPLDPGWTERAEAARRGIVEYHRESDTVFAGNVAWLWRFDDHPEADVSPSTTYWVVSALDLLVVRVDRETPKPDGSRSKVTTQLTGVRVVAEPELFTVPKAYRKVEPPGR